MNYKRYTYLAPHYSSCKQYRTHLHVQALYAETSRSLYCTLP